VMEMEKFQFWWVELSHWFEESGGNDLQPALSCVDSSLPSLHPLEIR
jgi:hypothetical protein